MTILFNWQMKMQRPREVNSSAQGHTASVWQSWDADGDSQTPELLSLTITSYDFPEFPISSHRGILAPYSIRSFTVKKRAGESRKDLEKRVPKNTPKEGCLGGSVS